MAIQMVYLNMHRFQRAKPIIIDPGLYQKQKTDIYWAVQQRTIPTAFRLFTGGSFSSIPPTLKMVTVSYDISELNLLNSPILMNKGHDLVQIS